MFWSNVRLESCKMVSVSLVNLCALIFQQLESLFLCEDSADKETWQIVTLWCQSPNYITDCWTFCSMPTSKWNIRLTKHTHTKFDVDLHRIICKINVPIKEELWSTLIWSTQNVVHEKLSKYQDYITNILSAILEIKALNKKRQTMISYCQIPKHVAARLPGNSDNRLYYPNGLQHFIWQKLLEWEGPDCLNLRFG